MSVLQPAVLVRFAMAYATGILLGVSGLASAATPAAQAASSAVAAIQVALL